MCCLEQLAFSAVERKAKKMCSKKLLKFLKAAVPMVVMALAFAVAGVPQAFAQATLGTGRVTSVTPTDGGCVAGPNGAKVQSWEVQEGKTYEVTLSNVTECDGDTIQVIVLSSSTGNQCLTANKTGEGEYKFTITMPDNACFTYPIKYCTSDCSPSTGKFARRSDGGNFQAHLRAALFDGDCNHLGEDTDCEGGKPQCEEFTICGIKFYDKDADGEQDGDEPGIPGWKIELRDNTSALVATVYTAADGTYCFTLTPDVNPAGTYTVTEVPPDASWVPSTDAECAVEVDYSGAECSAICDFGNYCLVPSGGRTLGYWSNKNGQATFNTIGGLNIVNACCLSNATSAQAAFASYAAFRTWLLKAAATNMAYMLSAQMAAMKLNVAAGFVNGSAFDLCSGMTINALLLAANAELCLHPTAFAGDAWRAYQESLKDCLDALNNGGLVIPPDPCPFDTPY
jgi:hypothetical protein